ncbi:putative SIR2 family histone deacetylase [Aspergillus steynii IBT 23096]|uniref:NAD-dependent protein deacetylase n=1 Tax=Aspergillus steynii IBT 23096 TaxID=1392250 RepID=A0A2I2GMK8_9EURO|nr:putative SIR2 family histone deacetylase [Aspergillus steynii IBT 23096]PLB54117.1 putative SIR2 family histone deacetylase [Aspergillus steynii IBT 23096]
MESTSNAQSSSETSSNINTLAHLIQTGQAKNIIVIAGAGISTAAGIPDFRSPTTGLYHKLAPLKLPYPEAIFQLSYFKHTPEPFYAIARARHPRNLKPTISHAFLALLAKKGLLEFVFCQNIDSLELDAGVPSDKALSVHGNWKSQRCSTCRKPYPGYLMKQAIEKGEVPYCLHSGCGGAVKPDVVFFGESLPAAFDVEVKRLPKADLVLVMGTSLKVHPVAGLPRQVAKGVPRVLINNERAGDIGYRESDMCILGSCDESVLKVADALGWKDELEGLWQDAMARKEQEEPYDGPELDELIERLAAKNKDRMVSEGHQSMLEKHLASKFAGVLREKPNIG